MLQAARAAEAVKIIRQHTDKGTLHMNSNGSLPQNALKLFEAGLTSMRVSMCSAREDTYNGYYQPRGYKFADVLQTIKFGREHGVWISVNLLLLPGLTDTPREVEALVKMFNDLDVNMVQLRNLNIDPDWLFTQIDPPVEKAIGVPAFIETLKRECPHLHIGSHNPAREEM